MFILKIIFGLSPLIFFCVFYYYLLKTAGKIKLPVPYNVKSDPPPLEGDRIRITWLPYNNAYPEPNCYIGSEGVVDWVDTEDGSFHLRMESGAGLMVGIRRYGRKPEYKYELI